MRALLVEYSNTYQLILSELLNGYSIVHKEVTTGEAALSILDGHYFDLICVSMQLPDTTGVDLVKKLKTMPHLQNTIFLLLTSEVQEAKLKQMTAEVDYVIQKKNIQEIKSLLAELVQDEPITCNVSGHILYIEDHLTLANMIIDILQSMGLTVDHFSSAESGLEALEAQHYNLILLDIILAGKKDGIAMIEEIRAKEDDTSLIPILGMSGKLNDSERINALKTGANDFIVKPVIQAELIARAKNLIVAQQLYQQVLTQKKELEHMAMTDQLTGLYNRHYLAQFIKKVFSTAKRHKYPLSLVMIDLDKFKQINDKFGHEKGDQVLVTIAKILQSECRIEDAVVRLGGDEFLLVMPHCSLEQAKEKADSIRLRISQLTLSNIKISASIGLSSTEQGSFVFEHIFNCADEATYQAKASGGNNTKWYEVSNLARLQ